MAFFGPLWRISVPGMWHSRWRSCGPPVALEVELVFVSLSSPTGSEEPPSESKSPPSNLLARIRWAWYCRMWSGPSRWVNARSTGELFHRSDIAAHRTPSWIYPTDRGKHYNLRDWPYLVGLYLWSFGEQGKSKRLASVNCLRRPSWVSPTGPRWNRKRHTSGGAGIIALQLHRLWVGSQSKNRKDWAAGIGAPPLNLSVGVHHYAIVGLKYIFHPFSSHV